MVMKPSILSKLLQKLLYELTLNKSATPTIAVKIATDQRIIDFLGLYCSDFKAIMTQRTKMISVIILKAKPLPVINGKSIEEETMNGMKGMRKRPERTRYLKTEFAFMAETITYRKNQR